jgi:hypothetical protein
MRVNWERLIKLLLPIRLRASKILFALLMSLAKWTSNKYDKEYAWILNLMQELKYTSQVAVMRKLLNDKFDNKLRRIYFIDGTDGNVSFVGDDTDVTFACNTSSSDFKESEIMWATPDKETTVGEDFIIVIPIEIEDREKEISKFIDKYILLGVGYSFKVQDKAFILATKKDLLLTEDDNVVVYEIETKE